jgi:hypothetical protein
MVIQLILNNRAGGGGEGARLGVLDLLLGCTEEDVLFLYIEIYLLLMRVECLYAIVSYFFCSYVCYYSILQYLDLYRYSINKSR